MGTEEILVVGIGGFVRLVLASSFIKLLLAKQTFAQTFAQFQVSTIYIINKSYLRYKYLCCTKKIQIFIYFLPSKEGNF